MRHKSKLANICVSLSIKDWPCFRAFTPACLAFISLAVSANLGTVAVTFLAEIGGKNGLQIHIFASLTHIVARFWQFATVFSRIDGFSALA